MNRFAPCRQHVLLAALVVAFPALTQAQSKPSVEIELAGIQVVHEGIDSKEQFVGSYPFNATQKGCRLALLLKSTDERIIDIARSKSEALIDSTRQSLLNEKPDPKNFGLKKAPMGNVTVELELWTDLKEEKIPFAFTAGFGW